VLSDLPFFISKTVEVRLNHFLKIESSSYESSYNNSIFKKSDDPSLFRIEKLAESL